MKIIYFSLIVAFLGLQSAVQAQVKFYNDKSQSTITYSMNHILHSWTGTSSDFTAVIVANEDKSEITQVAVSAKISTFDSQNSNRDSHMMEVTEAIKYPAVNFAGKSITAIDKNKFEVSGKIIFHGITRDISFEATQKKSGKSLEVIGGFTIKMTDFEIERPSLMGIATDDEIKINFKVVFN